jgi:hypothetical protein
VKYFVVLTSLAAAVFAGPFVTGVIDTIGGTTWDNQYSGPAMQWLAYDPAYGIHACWTYSAQGSSWPDRTIRYNFLDRATGSWSFNDPDFMASGTNSQARRTGYGLLEVDPTDGTVIIASHYSTGMPDFTAVVTEDIAPGAGIFDECVGEPTLASYFLPVPAKSPNGNYSLLLIKFQVSENLYFSNSNTWCTWQTPTFWAQLGASGENLVASRTSNKLFTSWMTGNNVDALLSYRTSTDAGNTWDDIQPVTPPAAYGMDTIPVCYTGATAIFDKDDNWQFVTVVAPVVADSAWQNPAQIWLYNSGTSEWHFIHRAGSQNLAGELGGATICGRPSLGQDPVSGRLYCAWEEFDSTNVEPSTGLLRADIWMSWSADGGTWADPVRITEKDQSSKRFPFVARNCQGDSVAIGFLQDSIAGFNSGGTGAISRNPLCVWRGGVSGIEESRTRDASRLTPTATLVRNRLVLQPANRNLQTGFTLLDLSGRRLMTLHAGSNDVSSLAPGVYFVQWVTGKRTQRSRLTIVR